MSYCKQGKLCYFDTYNPQKQQSGSFAGRPVGLFEKIHQLCAGGSSEPCNVFLSGQRREVVCYKIKLSVNLTNQIFCHLRYTHLRLVDDLFLT